jgi:hypothetical protein
MMTLEPDEQYDIILLYGDGDDENATKLKRILHRFVRLSGDQKVSFYPEGRLGVDQFEWLDEGLSHSCLKFILFNRNTVDDTWAKFQEHNALKTMLRQRDKSIVPVKLHKDDQVPILLDIYPVVDVYKLLKECHLETVHNVDELEDDDIDYDLLKRIAKAIDSSSRSHSRYVIAQQEVQSDLVATETPTQNRHACGIYEKHNLLTNSGLINEASEYGKDQLHEDFDDQKHGAASLSGTDISMEAAVEKRKTPEQEVDTDESLLKMTLHDNDTSNVESRNEIKESVLSQQQPSSGLTNVLEALPKEVCSALCLGYVVIRILGFVLEFAGVSVLGRR